MLGWQAFDSAAPTAHAIDVAQEHNQYGAVPARKYISIFPSPKEAQLLLP